MGAESIIQLDTSSSDQNYKHEDNRGMMASFWFVNQLALQTFWTKSKIAPNIFVRPFDLKFSEWTLFCHDMFTCTMYINQTQAVDQLKTQLDMGTTMMLLEVEMVKMEIILVIICGQRWEPGAPSDSPEPPHPPATNLKYKNTKIQGGDENVNISLRQEIRWG